MTYSQTEAKPLIDQYFKDWNNLFERMKYDADLFNLVKLHRHVLDVDDHEIANSVYIVLNDAADFAWRVESLLASSVEQVNVTAESKRFDTAYVENFIKAAYVAADDLLALKGQFSLNPFIDQQNCRRGSEVAFFNFHIEKGKMVPTIGLWDTGYFVCSNDQQGLSATGYKCYRSKEQIMTEYPDVKDVKGGKDSEVLYVLTRDSSELWVESMPVRRIANKLGYVPVVYRKVPMGSMLMDKDTFKYQGESILFLIRDLLPELNRFISIIQSLNLQELDHALQVDREVLTPASAYIPTVDEVTKPGTVNEVNKGTTGYQKMPIGELRQQAEILHKMIQDRVDKVMNNFQAFPGPRTATEILALNQAQETVILPRMANRALLKRDGAKMIIKQVLAECDKYGVREIELDGQNWDVSKLKGIYKIEFKYSFKDPRMDAARQSLATAQRGLIPDRDIRVSTLLREDWEEDENQLRWEEAERLSPLIKMNRTRRAVGKAADEGEPGAEEELMMLTLQMIPALRQAVEGLMVPGQAEEVKPGQPMVPLLPTAAAGGVANG
jgi:hypothetical protein